MNVKNLSNGMIVKNYNDMCKLLDEKIKSGCSKKSQLIDWERFFKYHKDKHAFVIDEVYEHEKPKPPRKDSVYAKLTELVLLNKLSLEKNCEVEMSKYSLYQYLGFCNETYISPERNYQALVSFAKSGGNGVKYNEMSFRQAEYYYNEFSTFVNRKLERILFDALDSMQKRYLIFYKKKYKIKIYDNDEKTYYIRDASNAEVSRILKIISDYKKNNPQFKFINYYNRNEYYEGLRQCFMKAEGWDSAFMVVDIIINDDKGYLRQDVSRVTSELIQECETNRIALNRTIVERFNQHFKDVFEKDRNCKTQLENDVVFGRCQNNTLNATGNDNPDENEDDDSWGTANPMEYKPKDYNDDFVDLQRELIDIYIKIESDELIMNKDEKSQQENV